MKKIKLMLYAILIMATVGGALAFKAKTPDVCVYSRFLTIMPLPATTICNRVTPDCVTSTTIPGSSKEYATILPCENGKCPNATTVCPQFKSLGVE